MRAIEQQAISELTAARLRVTHLEAALQHIADICPMCQQHAKAALRLPPIPLSEQAQQQREIVSKGMEP